MQISDPRIVLKGKLLETGISKAEATAISLEAGSSQTTVDREYLDTNYHFSNKIKIEILYSIGKFYSGSLVEN